MNNLLLYINGILADVYDNTSIATTLQVMQVGNITGRNISHTNRISLPSSATNNRIFEHSNSVYSTSRIPYNFVTVTVIQEGIETISGWRGILSKAKAGGYDLEIFDSTKGFFDALKGKYVDQIDLGVYTRFLAFHLNHEDVTPGAPVIDYGRLLVPDTQLDNNNFEADQFAPWKNEDGTETEWTEVTGGKIGVTLAVSSPGNSSRILSANYNFQKGFTYRIVMSFNVLNGTTTGTLTLKLLLPDVDQHTIDIVNTSTLGFKTIDETILASSSFNKIEIEATQNTSGTTKTIALNYIMIIPIHSINVKQPYFLPVMGYKDILEKIIEGAGYTWDNQLETGDTAYLERLAITFSKRSFHYNKWFRERFEFNASPDGTQVISADSTHKKILFPITNKNGSEQFWNPSTSMYEVPEMDFNLGVRLYVNIVVDISDYTTGNILFSIYDGTFPYFYPDTVVLVGSTVGSNGLHTIAFRMDTWLIGDSAQDFGVAVIAQDGATIEVLSGSFYAEIVEKPIGVWHMSNIILPDMLQKDFFADFLFRFGMLYYQDGTKLVTVPIKKLIANRDNAPDWTMKRDTSFEEEVVFEHGNYAQVNLFGDSGSEDSQKGRLTIDSDQLEDERTIYTSPFRAPEYITVDGVRVVRVPVFGYESNNRLDVNPEFEEGVRLVYLRDPMDGDPPIEYDGTPDTDHYFAVYDDPRSEYRADWQYFLDNYYQELQRHLNDAKVVVRRYNLTGLDIKLLDLTVPIYDAGAYFKIEKVENYIPGRPTKVTLFKIS